MKTIVSALLVTTLFLTSSISLAEEYTKDAEEVSWLYILVSKNGAISKSDTGYSLTLNNADIQSVIMFSDRPARETKEISLATFSENWNAGADSFALDYPNAAITIEGETQIVQLPKVTVSDKTIEFSLQQDGDNPIHQVQGGHTVVFVDSGFMEQRRPEDGP